MKKFTKALIVALLGITTVGCNNTPDTSSSSSVTVTDPLVAAIESRIVLTQDKQEVSDDFEVPNLVKITYEGTSISVNITWTADKENVTFEELDGKTWARLTRPEKGEEAVTVNLTASFDHEGKKGTKAFRVIVTPKQGSEDLWGVEPTGTVMSWSEFRAAEVNSPITVQGTVLAWTYDSSYSNGNVFLQDENGGYYAYRLKAAKSDYENYLAVGNEVILEGKKSVYEGLHQLNQDTVTSIKVVNRVEKGTPASQARPAPKDVTEAARKAELEPLQSTWATVLGTYVNKDGYHYIQVGANEYQLYNDSKYNNETLDAVKETMATFVDGDAIRLTGIVGMYKNPQFYPYEIAKSDETIVVTNEEKAIIALNAASEGFADVYDAETEVELYTSTDADVSVSYSLNSDADATIYALNTETNKLTITPTETETTATLTVTVTCGDVTKTNEITLKACAKIEIISLEKAIELANTAGDDYSTEKYYVKGTITNIASEKYGNMTISDGTTELYIYGLYSKDGSTLYESMETKPVVGDEVVLYGVLGTYTKTDKTTGDVISVTPQMKDAWLHSHVAITSLTNAIELANTAGDAYSTEKYYVKGTITNIADTKYGNMTISDGTTELYIYGLYSNDGSTRYDKMETKPAVGDEVVLYGILGTYTKTDKDTGDVISVTPQMKNAWLYSHKSVVAEGTNTSVGEALKAAEGETVTFEGKVTEIYYAWSTEYNNMSFYVTDDAGNTILVFRSTTQVTINDIVKVEGTIAMFNEKPQIGEGSTVTILEEGVYVDPTATATAALSFADKANRVSQDTESQVWSQNGITFTNSKGSATSNVADYADPVRCYKNSDIKVEYTSNFSKIVLVTVSGYSFETGDTIPGATVTIDGTTVTIELTTPATSFEVTGLPRQIRFNSIAVYAA